MDVAEGRAIVSLPTLEGLNGGADHKAVLLSNVKHLALPRVRAMPAVETADIANAAHLKLKCIAGYGDGRFPAFAM